VYLTPRARSSRGIHPSVLEVLPDIISAPEAGTWFVVTVGRYTGIYPEWYIPQSLTVRFGLTMIQASSQPNCQWMVWGLLQAAPYQSLRTCGI
jgi:hypothetical protein